MSVERDNTQRQYLYRFGTAEFDSARLALRVDGHEVSIQRRPLEILERLLRHAGEVVTREELMEDLWGGRPTVDNVLHNAVNKLRTALGERNGSFVRTVSRVGYRFEGRVERTAVGQIYLSTLQFQPGQSVPGSDRLQLLRQLPESGQAEVWLATDRHDGSLRVLKFATSSVQLRRLKREATVYRLLHGALAGGDGIVRVLSRQFEHPPFYIESEFSGESLLAWSDGRLDGLTLPERLALFLQIADALAAAHSVGVLHMDLKPANVLVREEAGGWRLRLADFGSSALLEPDRLQAMGITRMGLTVSEQSGISGSPLYMAPELLRGASPTVQSDVFALGTLLFQLIVADLRRPMASGWQREIADELLREDIQAATEGDPRFRLQTVQELARRIRQLEQRRIEATERERAQEQARQMQRLRERARERRPWMIGITAVLTLGLAISLMLYWRSERSALALQRQNQVVEELNAFLASDLIGAADPLRTANANMTVVEAVKLAAGNVDSKLSASAATRVALHAAMQESLSALTEYSLAIDAGKRALAALHSAPDVRREIAVRLRLADDLSSLSAIGQADEHLATVAGLLETRSLQSSHHAVHYWLTRAGVLAAKLDLDNALQDAERAQQLAATVANVPPEIGERIDFRLSDLYTLKGRHADGERLARKLVQDQSQRLGAEHPTTQYSRLLLANSIANQLRHDEALAVLGSVIDNFERSLGPAHRRTMRARSVRAGVYFRMKQFEPAAEEWLALVPLVTSNGGKLQDEAITLYMNAGMAMSRAGNLPRAESILRDALASASQFLPGDAPRIHAISYELAVVLLDRELPVEADALLRNVDADAINRSVQQVDWPGRLAYQRGRAALQLGDRSAALQDLGAALRQVSSENAPNDSVTIEKVRQALLMASVNR